MRCIQRERIRGRACVPLCAPVCPCVRTGKPVGYTPVDSGNIAGGGSSRLQRGNRGPVAARDATPTGRGYPHNAKIRPCMRGSTQQHRERRGRVRFRWQAVHGDICCYREGRSGRYAEGKWSGVLVPSGVCVGPEKLCGRKPHVPGSVRGAAMNELSFNTRFPGGS